MTATSKALSTDTPAAVTFDTLSAAQELRQSGFEDRQAEAIVTTISTAMSETVATRADLELAKADLEKQIAATRAEIVTTRTDLEKQIVATRKDLELQGAAIRAEIIATRTDLEAQGAATRKDMELQGTEIKGQIKSLEQSMAAMQDRIIIRLGAVMVSMTFLLLAVGPFYIRWVLSMMAA
ncbi:MAG: DUF1640 domain-containing protein [Gammaproteobacteria bacterium]|nr:DUF1640 domain-containing protein [Gammaproteobacteria bacterium]